MTDHSDDRAPPSFLAARRDWLRVETVDRGGGAWDVVLVIDGTYTQSASVSRAEMIDYFTRWLAGELAECIAGRHRSGAWCDPKLRSAAAARSPRPASSNPPTTGD